MMTWMDEGMQFFGLDQSADRCNHVGYWACAAEASQIAELDEAQATSQSRKPRGSNKARGRGCSVASQLLGTAASAYHNVFGPKLLQSTPSRSLSNLKDNPLTLETLNRKELERSPSIFDDDTEHRPKWVVECSMLAVSRDVVIVYHVYYHCKDMLTCLIRDWQLR